MSAFEKTSHVKILIQTSLTELQADAYEGKETEGSLKTGKKSKSDGRAHRLFTRMGLAAFPSFSSTPAPGEA
jgi:hypothetical protein